MDRLQKAEAEAALARILNSEIFSRTARMKDLLSYIVENTLLCRSDKLLGKILAEDVFGIQPSERDRLSAVRVEVGRLRKRLKHYYDGEGKFDDVRISIPKGAYVAEFSRCDPNHRKFGFRPSAHANRLRPTLAIGATAFALVFASGLIFAGKQKAPVLPNLVVADFQSQLPAFEALATGLTADMVNRLAKFSQISSVTRQTSDYASHNGADYLLSGYVLQGSEGPRLNIELVALPSGQVAWVDEFGPPDDDTDLYSNQKGVADKVARVLVGRRGEISRIEQAELDRGAKREAYRCVLRYHAYQAGRSMEAHREIRHCLELASKTNPTYAEVWTSLAQIYLDELKNNFNPRPHLYDPLEKARDSALKAIKLAPRVSSGYSVLAAIEYFRRDLDAFEAAGRKAVALNPNDADVLSYFAHYLSLSGKWDEGQELQYRAMAMAPGHPPVWHSSSVMNALRKNDYEKALYHARRAFDAGYYLSALYLTVACAYMGDVKGTSEALAHLEALRPSFREEIRSDLSKRHYPKIIVDKLQQGLELAYTLAKSE